MITWVGPVPFPFLLQPLVGALTFGKLTLVARLRMLKGSVLWPYVLRLLRFDPIDVHS